MLEAQPWHIDPIAERMREADAVEAWAAARLSPLEALEFSYNKSVEAWTITSEDIPVAMGGVVSPGCIWLLGTNWITENGLAFTRLVKPKIADLARAHKFLHNYVYEGNTVATRWLKAMGFTLEPAAPYGVHAAPFHYFWMKG